MIHQIVVGPQFQNFTLMLLTVLTCRRTSEKFDYYPKISNKKKLSIGFLSLRKVRMFSLILLKLLKEEKLKKIFFHGLDPKKFCF